jgi:uncharacterized membrane protein
MRKIIYILFFNCLFFGACNNSTSNTENTRNTVSTKAVETDPLAVKTAGLYNGYVPCADCEGIITFLLLNPDMTYRLEETYYKKDNKVFLTKGSWKTDNGKIILYDGNEVKLNYLVDGDKLWQLDHEGNRISGNLGDKYVLARKEKADNKVLKEKTNAGIDFVAHGNEPFWSLEIDKGNTITFNRPDMKMPASVPYTEPSVVNNIRQYHIESEATKLDITISSAFCSDGMSDFIYEYKVDLTYNGKKYSGCGTLLNTL